MSTSQAVGIGIVLLIVMIGEGWPILEFLVASVADAVMNRIHRRRAKRSTKETRR